ncbi:MAG: pyridoxal-dependent decarboxylase [Roseibium sp.]
MSEEGRHLDPEDWAQFSQEMHDLLDQCLERMQSARDLPWKPNPNDLADRLRLEKAQPASGVKTTFDRMKQDIMPYATGNTHPSFFGWVHGSGLPVSVGADLVASTMNSNCGGRDHGAVEVERAVLDWLLQISGLPESASAILTTGTSQATILAMSAARTRAFGKDVRQTGIQSLPEISVYVRAGTHSCVDKAMAVMGHGTDTLKMVAVDDDLQMDIEDLKKKVAEDRASGRVPLAVVATAGAVNTGVFDPVSAIADFCNNEDIWLHVDGAFGFWTILAEEPWKQLIKGMDRANSIACDFHKWMSVPYDCGACMIYDQDIHHAAFSSRPSYLVSHREGLAGGDLWFCDYGLDLSRGFRALKVWAAIKAIGVDAFGKAISDNCRQARLMGELAERSDVLELVHPVVSNLCCFEVIGKDPNEVAAKLQLSGEVVFSTTTLKGRSCLRAAIVNHRTTSDDIRAAMKVVERIARE